MLRVEIRGRLTDEWGKQNEKRVFDALVSDSGEVFLALKDHRGCCTIPIKNVIEQIEEARTAQAIPNRKPVSTRMRVS